MLTKVYRLSFCGCFVSGFQEGLALFRVNVVRSFRRTLYNALPGRWTDCRGMCFLLSRLSAFESVFRYYGLLRVFPFRFLVSASLKYFVIAESPDV